MIGRLPLRDLSGLPLTYPEVGATAGPLPAGYRHVHESALVGHGRARFEEAAASVMRWGMLRGAGARVRATSEVAAVGSEVVVTLGPIPAPCRVVYVLAEPDHRGFAYGTLPGHPERGEESFVIEMATDGTVFFRLVAFSRPARWYTSLAGPGCPHRPARSAPRRRGR